MPLGLALLSAAFPPEKRGAAIGIFSAITGVSVATGPLVGGAVVEGLAWEWIFWLNVPIGLLAIPLVLTRMRESRGPDTALDIPGLALVTAGALGIVWGLVRGNPAGWGSPEVVAALAAGVLLLAAFVAWELRAREPMLPMRFFRSRAFSAATRRSSSRSRRCSARVFFYAQFLQTGLGYGPLEAGLRLMPWTATFITVAPIAGALADRIGERPLMVGGLSLQAVGMALARADRRARHRVLELLAPLIVAGVGVSMAIPAAQNSAVGSVASDAIGKAAGDQQHDARARRRVRDRGRRRRLRRRGQLRLRGGVHRRLRARDRRRRRAGARRRRRRPGAARPPPRPASLTRAVPALEQEMRSDETGHGPLQGQARSRRGERGARARRLRRAAPTPSPRASLRDVPARRRRSFVTSLTRRANRCESAFERSRRTSRPLRRAPASPARDRLDRL